MMHTCEMEIGTELAELTVCGAPAYRFMTTTFEGGTPQEWKRNFWFCDACHQRAAEYEVNYRDGNGDSVVSRVTEEEF